MRRDIVVATVCGLLLGSALAARAEVSALTDRQGVYRSVRVQQSPRHGVWAPVAHGSQRYVLNPYGDQLGDLRPTVAENIVAPHYPWVVWSRLNDTHYDLAWSCWTEYQQWEPVSWLDPSSTAASGDSLDAYLTFDPAGRPYVAWWRFQNGMGQVFVSFFLTTTWMAPLPVSDKMIDARYPDLTVPAAGELVLHYQTPLGEVEHKLFLDLPVTITDDINPLDLVDKESKKYVDENP